MDEGQPNKSKSNNTIAEELERKILLITKQQRRYIKSIFLKMAQSNPANAIILYDYVMAQQNELNMKESTKEGTIKRIVWLSSFLAHKPFREVTKDDVLFYLNSKVRKPEAVDATHKWIGTYNGTQMVFSTFFRWLYNQDEPDIRKRITPHCMRGIKRLPRQEISPFKPIDLWSAEEHDIFLKYCPNKRDACYHVMAKDTSARPGELQI